MDEALGAVTRDEVERAVRAQLGSSAELDTWTVVELGRGRGGATTSRGTCRVSGTARVDQTSASWSQIRKVYVPPAIVAGIDMGRSIEHWNYWRREPELLASGHLQYLPGGIGAPTPYVIAAEDAAVTVWMEDLGELAVPIWSPHGLGRVAHGLGRLAGWFAGREPAEPWLSTDLLGQWVRDLPAMTAPLRGNGTSGWSHPLARSVFPNGPSSPVPRLLDTAASHLAALSHGPRTFCHRDTGLDNLVLRSDPDELTLFDWALAGGGAVGEDLGVLFASVARSVDGEPLAMCHSLLDHYRVGYQSAGGAPIDPEIVWRVAVVTAALREAIFAAFHISRAMEGFAAGDMMLTGLAKQAAVIEAFAEHVLLEAH